MAADDEGVRLQKVLAQAGIASRRAAENMIAEGRIEVNGKLVTEQGRRVDPERDVIRVDGSRIPPPRRHVYAVLNKPRGVVSTMDDPEGRLQQLGAHFGGTDQGNVFMFHCEAAMGKEYIPTYGMQKIPQGYDSFFAKPGQSGIMNNEMIVPSLNQFALRYLCEFE